MFQFLIVMLLFGHGMSENQFESIPGKFPAPDIYAGQLAFFGDKEPEAESPLETHVSLITINKNLKRGLYATLALFLITASLGLYWWKMARFYRLKRIEMIPEQANESSKGYEKLNSELEMLRNALNEERARVVRHEVQKKELLAYIEELKSMQGSTEVRHKTTQIQRIFAEQKTDDIVKKVENTAKVLYPELVETVQIRYPELNKLELQYCMMLTLGYNLDEVMSVLGRSEKAIKSLRYRIRKKMKLENSQSLGKFIKDINIYITENQ